MDNLILETEIKDIIERIENARTLMESGRVIYAYNNLLGIRDKLYNLQKRISSTQKKEIDCKIQEILK